jgi:hypothetical protein
MRDEARHRGTRAIHTALLVAGVAFIGFSAAHLIDEFLWGAPEEFHLAVGTTLVLALVFVTALAGLLVGAAMHRSASTFGLGLIGALIAVADIMKHGPEIALAGTWRFGPLSVALAAGLTLSAGLTGVLAFLTWRALRPRR